MAQKTFDEKWESFFKPEARSAGRRYFVKGVVTVSQPSDTEIQARIKISAPPKVSLKSESVDSSLLAAFCSCPTSRKAMLCKHIWAALLETEKSRSDFLDGKTEIEASAPGSDTPAAQAKAQAKAQAMPESRPLSQAQLDSRALLKDRQATYRKEQYQKQKLKVKSKKQAEKLTAKRPSKFAAPEMPEDIQFALHYFSENGIPMDLPLKAEAVGSAKKKLARVFHPDKGGSHDEILELIRNCDVLLEFIAATEG